MVVQDSNYTVTLREQLNLLLKWNKENIDKEPEQVRKNIETFVSAISSSRISF